MDKMHIFLEKSYAPNSNMFNITGGKPNDKNYDELIALLHHYQVDEDEDLINAPFTKGRENSNEVVLL